MGDSTDEAPLLLYLVRHGRTALNAENRLRGWTDPPLDAQGRKDAGAVAATLADVHLSSMYVSDLVRARVTGARIEDEQAKAPKTQVTAMLRPINFGELNGKPLKEAGPKIEAYAKAWRTKPGLKTRGGESFSDFQERMEEVVETAVAGAHAGSVGIVAHLRNCIWILAYALNGGELLSGDTLRLMDRVTQEVGRLSIVSYSRKDGWRVCAMNTDSALWESSKVSLPTSKSGT